MQNSIELLWSLCKYFVVISYLLYVLIVASDYISPLLKPPKINLISNLLQFNYKESILKIELIDVLRCEKIIRGTFTNSL